MFASDFIFHNYLVIKTQRAPLPLIRNDTKDLTLMEAIFS